MKAHSQMKVRGPAKVNSQQVIFELKHKVLLALNKLADRDTYQIGVEELEKTVENLTPDKVSTFLSCILDTDSEQKSAVRKECIRLMGTLARIHKGLVGPHLAKMVTSIVKRLKDPDSVVRDACVETMGMLASKLSSYEDQNDGVFVVLVKPLFEALGEQSKQMQSGSALCLAKVIDSTRDPPISILQRMLTRTTKLLNNPHFMAKPAVIELNRSIIQAGGAATKSILSTAIASIQEALKNSDWTTRKAASIALGEIASAGGSFLGTLRASCIRSLESCRFDKVKPVRDSVLHSLQYWRSLPGPDTPEPSEAGSSIKENFYGGDCNDLISTSDSGQKGVSLKKAAVDSAKRIPLSVKKTSQHYVQDPQHSKTDEWHIEIAVPKSHNVSLPDLHNEESEGSCVTKTLERITADVSCMQDIPYEYIPMDDKQECSSVSNLVSENYETKSVTISHDCLQEAGLLKQMGRSQQFKSAEISSEDQLYLGKMRDSRSLDSTVTDSGSEITRGCCSHMANEMVSIRKQLLEIEARQLSLMDHLRVFSSGTMDSLSMLQSKVLNLEYVVDRIAQDLVQGGRYSDLSGSKIIKPNQNVASPCFSTCTPRPSIDIRNRQSSLLPAKNSEIWEENVLETRRKSNVAKQKAEMWTNHTVKAIRNPIRKDMQKSTGPGTQTIGQMRKTDNIFGSALGQNIRQNNTNGNNGLWQRVKSFLCEGDLDSAYIEALSSGDDLILVELLDRTGPVLESLSQETVSEIVGTLASFLLEQRFINSIIPWLHQVVELSTINGPNLLVPSAKARHEFLSAVQEALNMEFSNPVERRSVAQLAMKLRQVWGKCA